MKRETDLQRPSSVIGGQFGYVFLGPRRDGGKFLADSLGSDHGMFKPQLGAAYPFVEDAKKLEL